MCGSEKGDLKHFLVWCPAYSDERQKNMKLQLPYQEHTVSQLYFRSNIEETKETIHKFWKIKEKKMKPQWPGQN